MNFFFDLKTLKSKLKKSPRRKALGKLFEIFDKEDADRINILYTLETRYSRLLHKEISEEESSENLMIERNKIDISVLRSIDTITKNEARNYYINQNKTFTKILIACTDSNRVPYMEKLFPLDIYPEREVISDIISSEDRIKAFDLVVVDNFSSDDTEEMSKRIFNHYFEKIVDIENKDIYILYFGPHFKELHIDPNYRKIVYFANSKFSIHTRIQEMLTFINHTGINQ